MAREKKRRQELRASQTQSLEWLLGAGEADLYGQVCWSIANRGTEIPRAGEVITLAGEDDLAGERFRLTRKSVENIGRCLGMRTCGEAVALFADVREAEPLGACGDLYVTAWTGEDVLLGLNAATGEEIWRFEMSDFFNGLAYTIVR